MELYNVPVHVQLQTTSLIISLVCLISSLVVTSGWGEQCIHMCTLVLVSHVISDHV